MKEIYKKPEADVICFAPAQAIALEQPGWGWEDGVFDSTPEARIIDDDDEEGR